jgi:hypothetical protein
MAKLLPWIVSTVVVLGLLTLSVWAVVSALSGRDRPAVERDVADSEVKRPRQQRVVEAYDRGLDHAHNGQFDEAINPRYAEAYYNRAIAHETKGEKAKAEEDLAQAKKLGYEAK